MVILCHKDNVSQIVHKGTILMGKLVLVAALIVLIAIKVLKIAFLAQMVNSLLKENALIAVPM